MPAMKEAFRASHDPNGHLKTPLVFPRSCLAPGCAGVRTMKEEGVLGRREGDRITFKIP